VKIRALEETDLDFVHRLNNEYANMSYWFEEPYQSLSELQSLYKKHILDESERRFIIEEESERIGVVELVEIDFIHKIPSFFNEKQVIACHKNYILFILLYTYMEKKPSRNFLYYFNKIFTKFSIFL